MNQGNNNPFVHVPKYDKTTGQPMPQWKQQVIMSKMTKRMEEEAQLEKELSNGLPEWKREILAKKEQKMMQSEDPILVRKRKIKSLRQEHDSAEVPPWKKELLQKKIEQINEEIEQLKRIPENGHKLE
eukprot:Seg2527.5 transcript_id=Seg2527.5/GoldUCD/mRNA.D3Y31 product="hypothetical protein" protein_id=Seg2527.5/GoldUCD/D3Y31